MKLTEEVTDRLVHRILHGAFSGSADAEQALRHSQVACEQLQRRLEMLIGPLGVQALLNRALRLAQRSTPWLATVHAEENGTLFGLDEAGAGLTKEALLEGLAAFIRHLVILLADLIGEELAWCLLHEQWTDQ